MMIVGEKIGVNLLNFEIINIKQIVQRIWIIEMLLLAVLPCYNLGTRQMFKNMYCILYANL